MKYKIYYTAHMCDHVYVEAESRDDARELGHDMANSEHPDSAHIDIDDVISEDDEPTNSTHNYHNDVE
jgi:hypothetical protein